MVYYDGSYPSTILNGLAVIKGFIQMNEPEKALEAADQLEELVRGKSYAENSTAGDDRIINHVGI